MDGLLKKTINYLNQEVQASQDEFVGKIVEVAEVKLKIVRKIAEGELENDEKTRYSEQSCGYGKLSSFLLCCELCVIIERFLSTSFVCTYVLFPHQTANCEMWEDVSIQSFSLDFTLDRRRFSLCSETDNRAMTH